MPIKTVTPQEMERYARVLEASKDRGVLSAHEHRRLHVAFVATDYAAQRWSVGLRTGVWSRLDDGKWVPAAPPDRLHLDETLAAELDALEPAAAEPAPGDAVTQSVTASASDPASRAARDPEGLVERRTGPDTTTPTDWSPIAMCTAIALGFAAGGWARGSIGAYVLAVFFAALAVFIVFLNRMPRRT